MQTTYVLKVTPYNGAREVEVAFGFLDPFKMTCLINKKKSRYIKISLKNWKIIHKQHISLYNSNFYLFQQ